MLDQPLAGFCLDLRLLAKVLLAALMIALAAGFRFLPAGND